MNKKLKIVLIIIISLMVLTSGILLYQYIRIKTATIKVVLKKDLNVEFNSKVKVADLVESINGKILTNYKIDTTKLGEKEIEFKFRNDENIKLKYAFKIKVVDTTKPVVWLKDIYNVQVGSDINLKESILCGDNYDNKPKCQIEGEYDLNTIGSYNLIYKATDKNGNITSKPFQLNVYEPLPTTNSEENSQETIKINFSDVVNTYKTKKNKIGIDVSKWQGDIDFKKVKNAGVEFVMIRLGGTRGKNGKYFVDEKFKQNIKAAQKAHIPVGLYFYSYADSSKKAREDAEWVLKQIKKYDISLPIAFDWEEWQHFNDYNLSFYGLTSMAEEFLKVIEKAGYQGMLYSSKNYLENIWLETDYDIWLAHYTQKTDYKKDYKMWQLCDNGVVDGINGLIDIDIMY